MTLTSAAVAETPWANRAMNPNFAASRYRNFRREGLPGPYSCPARWLTRFFTVSSIQLQACRHSVFTSGWLGLGGNTTGTGRDSMLTVTLREVPRLKIGEGRARRGNTRWQTLP